MSAGKTEHILSASTIDMIDRHKNDIYTNYVSEEAIGNLKDEQLHIGEGLGVDRIMVINDYSNVGSVMQSYIMHDPYVYSRYNDGHIGGYSDTLNLAKGLDIKEEDKYLKVMSGWVSDETGEYGVEYIDGEEELTISEQLLIQDTWGHVRSLLVDDDDITSV